LGSLKAELATTEVDPGPGGRELLEEALRESRRRGDSYIGTEHLLLAVARLPGGRASDALAAHGVTLERLEALLTEADAEWQRRHPSVWYRLGTAFQFVRRRLRRRS
jgi:ATP-dependent Clp protease ATP-binding subunit ClpA